jgi:hypothetical protein
MEVRMSSFTILDSVVASSSRQGGIYKDALTNLGIATKNADGSFSGPAASCDKPGQVLGFRAAAKDLGFAVITRKQADKKTLVMKVNKADAPVRKAKTDAAAKPAKKAAK